MRLIYSSDKIKENCTSLKAAKKLFGGDMSMVKALLSKINALENAENIKDIIVQPSFSFHKLSNKYGKNLEGFFAIDVKTRKEPWRIILQPLDEREEPYIPCNIDQIAEIVKIVEVMEVSNHYE